MTVQDVREIHTCDIWILEKKPYGFRMELFKPLTIGMTATLEKDLPIIEQKKPELVILLAELLLKIHKLRHIHYNELYNSQMGLFLYFLSSKIIK